MSPMSLDTPASTNGLRWSKTAESVLKEDNISDIIDVDSFEFEDILEHTKTRTCKGYTLSIPNGKSPHTIYPFALHDTLILPWDYVVKNSVMSLFARSCAGYSKGESFACQPCQQLLKDKILEGVLTRIAEGVHENAKFAYHGFGGLQEMLHRKTQQIDFYRFHGLNQAKKLLYKAAALSEQKRLVTAIASGKVQCVDRIISIGLHQKKGIRGLLASFEAAAQGYYRPKSFTEEEDMRALLLWKLGGNRVAQINHRAQDAPTSKYHIPENPLYCPSNYPFTCKPNDGPSSEQCKCNTSEHVRCASRSNWSGCECGSRSGHV